jgi:hypothetical protein
MRPQTRIRKMRRHGTSYRRDDEVRQTYFDPALRAARAAAGQQPAASETSTREQENTP